MMNRIILLSTFLVVIFSLATGNLMAREGENGKEKDNPPFLITGTLPHLTKLLMQQWDNVELNLSDKQKSNLLVVRKETVAGVLKLGREIAPLEQQVAEGIVSGKTPAELQSIVQTISKLKTEATMLHLRCIFSTSRILEQYQLDFLKSL